MKLNLHIPHTFSILIIAALFINPKLKGQNCILQSYNFATHLVEAGTSDHYIHQFLEEGLPPKVETYSEPGQNKKV